MKMTREEAIRNFRERWASLAISGSEDKAEFLRRHGFQYVYCDCFLCEYVEKDDIRDCDKCPIEWPETRIDMYYKCSRSFYGDWERARTPEERKHLAAIIRDLPEKKEPKPEPKFSIGDKVYPVSKTVPEFEKDIEDDAHWRNSKQRGYFFVTDIDENKTKATGETVYICNYRDGYADGNYFFESDLRPYVEPTPKPKFKPGDRIRIKPMSEIQMIVDAGPVFGGWSHGMTEYTEKVYTVQRFINGMDGVFGYRLREIFYSWDERFLDLVVDEPEVKKEYPKELQAEWVGFKVGDRVRVKKGLVPDKWYDNVRFAQEMSPYLNADAVITRVSDPYGYRLNIDGGKWFWSKGMLEPMPSMFKAGDRVRVNGNIGTVRGIIKAHPPVGIEFDNPVIGGHDFNDHLPAGKKGHCYFHLYKEIELLPHNHCPEDKTVPVQTITIKFKGPETICTIKNQFGTFKGKAKCHPTDQWNEKTGADLALGRAVDKFNEYEPDA